MTLRPPGTHVQKKNGNMALLWRGYSFPNSFLYARCFFAAQLIIWPVDTAQNSHATQVKLVLGPRSTNGSIAPAQEPDM
jgi:hypothetical protein